MGCGSVFQLELEPNFIGKILPLSDANEITSGPFMTEGNGGFPLLRMLFVIIYNYPERIGAKFFYFNLSFDCFRIFQESLERFLM